MLIRVHSTTELGSLIRLQRKRQGLRQADLASLVGASHVFLGDAEKGRPTVQLGRVLQLLDELGIALYVEVPEGFDGPHSPAPGA